MIRFLIQTFGCKTNQYESQAVRELLSAAGHAEADSPADADILIVNTCGVTGRAVASCRNAVRKAMRTNPALRLVVTGCGVDLGEKFPDAASGPPLRIPNAQKHTFPSLLAEWLADGTPVAVAAADDDDRFGLSISAFHGHTRAFLKIQDGCDNRCAYCAVPLARGKPESRKPEDILAEAGRLVAGGHGELVLTGINIGNYRGGNMDFPAIVARIAETPGLIRLRLGSVEPPQMNRNLAGVMRNNEKICPHVHLPMQSGNDGVLAAMGRRYTRSEFLDKTAMLREELPNPAITTDVIVGFPGEDEDAFRESVDACLRAGFSRLHVFLFSPRPGTPAAQMRRTVPDRTVEGRKSRLIALGEKLSLEYAASCVGLRERVIIEKSENGVSGLSDRYLKVRLEDGTGMPGEMSYADIVGAAGNRLIGKASCFESPPRLQ